jgi:hypothetical protein
MSSYGHDVSKIAHDHYRLSWTIDRKYSGSRLRFPTSFHRDTDEPGAKRFAKKWKLPLPPSHGTSNDAGV